MPHNKKPPKHFTFTAGEIKNSHKIFKTSPNATPLGVDRDSLTKGKLYKKSIVQKITKKIETEHRPGNGWCCVEYLILVIIDNNDTICIRDHDNLGATIYTFKKWSDLGWIVYGINAALAMIFANKKLTYILPNQPCIISESHFDYSALIWKKNYSVPNCLIYNEPRTPNEPAWHFSISPIETIMNDPILVKSSTHNKIYNAKNSCGTCQKTNKYIQIPTNDKSIVYFIDEKNYKNVPPSVIEKIFYCPDASTKVQIQKLNLKMRTAPQSNKYFEYFKKHYYYTIDANAIYIFIGEQIHDLYKMWAEYKVEESNLYLVIKDEVKATYKFKYYFNV